MAFMLMWYWTLTGCRYLQKWVTYSLGALCCIFCSACVRSNKFFVCKVNESPLVLYCFCVCCLCFREIKEDRKPLICCWLIPICLMFKWGQIPWFRVLIFAFVHIKSHCLPRMGAIESEHLIPADTSPLWLYTGFGAGWFHWAALPCHHCEWEPPSLCD